MDIMWLQNSYFELTRYDSLLSTMKYMDMGYTPGILFIQQPTFRYTL